jgi:hypothetical protein
MKNLMKKIFAPFAVFALALGVSISVNSQSSVVGAKAEGVVVQFGSGKTNNWTTNYQKLGSDYIGIATSSHYAQVSSTNLFGAGNVLDSDILVTFKIGTYGGTGQQGTFSVSLLDSDNNVLSTSSGLTNLTGANESYDQGPTGGISVSKPANPSSISTIKVFLSDVGTITTSKYVRLQELTLDFTTITSGPTLTSISVTNPPTKTNYFEGETFDPSGIEVTATYSDNSTAIVTSEVMYSPAPLVAGEPVIASYLGETTTVPGITVTAINTTGITILTPGTEIFTLGQNFNSFGLSIEVHKNNSTTEIITSGLNVSGVDTMVLGVQTATVEYDGFTTNYSVTVTNNGASVGDSVVASDLFFSEYIEGSGNNKVIEIFNGTGSTVSLSDYSVKLFANGALESKPTNVQTFTTDESLANGSVISLVASSASDSFKKGNFKISSVANFNGDDAVALYKGTTLIDVIGVIGTDPGKEWTGTAANGTGTTLDKTLVRTSIITGPNTTFTWGEWNVYAIDTATYLGTHDFVSADATILEQATSFAQYVMTGIGLDSKGKCEAVLSSLQVEFDYMVEGAKTEFQTNPDALFVNARARMVYLENWVGVSSGQFGRTTASNNARNNLIAVVTIGAIGLTSILGYYFIGKKKKFD